MKIIHTADWHLGNVFHAHSRVEEHRHFLNWLVGQIRETRPDALLITGDVFDTANPSAVAEELLYNFLLNATTVAPGLQVVITAGNHDSASRFEAPAALLKTHNVYVRATIHYTPEGEPDFPYYVLPLASLRTGRAACTVVAVPYLRSTDYPPTLSTEEGLRYFIGEIHKARRKGPFGELPTIVAAHFYATGSQVAAGEHSERIVVGGADQVGIDAAGRGVSYVALGHIHRSQRVGDHARYAGSPIALSFSEKTYKRGVDLIDIDDEGGTDVQRLDYEPLRALLTLPEGGQGGSPAELLRAVDALPRRRKDDDGADWPYIEIQLRETQPEPAFLNDITRALADKAAHFCRIQRLVPERTDAPDAEAEHLVAAEQLDPLDLARQRFKALYDAEMPEPMVERFNEALRQVLDEE